MRDGSISNCKSLTINLMGRDEGECQAQKLARMVFSTGSFVADRDIREEALPTSFEMLFKRVELLTVIDQPFGVAVIQGWHSVSETDR